MKTFIGELLINFVIISAILFEINMIYLGAGVFILKYMLDHSNAHVNPFITIVKFFKGNISNNELIKYICAQIIGSFFAYQYPIYSCL